MRSVLILGAAVFMTFAMTDAMVSEAEAARCPLGQMYRPSRGTCVSKAEFSSQLRGSRYGHSARAERRSARREARAERAREARAARAAEAKPASNVIFCSTERCVQRLEQKMSNTIQ